MLSFVPLNAFLELFMATSSFAGDLFILGPAKQKRVYEALRTVEPHCIPANLLRTHMLVQHALGIFTSGKAAPVDLQAAIKGLPETLWQELGENDFLAGRAAFRGLLHANAPLDTMKPPERDAVAEVLTAGRCLALGEPTACVLHLVRVIEFGGKVIAKSLNIDPASLTIGTMATEVQKIANERQRAGSIDEHGEQLYNELVTDLRAFARGYRNDTIHELRQFSDQQALQLYVAVSSFIEHIQKSLGDLNDPKPPHKSAIATNNSNRF